MDVLVMIFVFLSPQVSTSPLAKVAKNKKYFDLDNILLEQAVVENKVPIEREYKIKGMKLARRILTDFELSVIRCCSSNIVQNVNRCFEVNGFGGVNFLVNPCGYLNSDENMKNIENVIGTRNAFSEDPLDNEANTNEEAIEVEGKKLLSKNESSIVR